MATATALAHAAWMGYWHWMRRYHRFEVKGIEHVLKPGPAMIVGFHGQPGARDLIMLQALLLRAHGQVTYAVAHDAIFRIPVLRELAVAMEMVSRDRVAIAAVVARAQKLVIAPGGIREAWSLPRDRYRVRWQRTGYLRLALAHRLPIIPVVGVGSGDAFYSAYDAYRWWKPIWDRTGLPEGFGLYLGVGPLGLWPFTPPFPARVVQYIGAPIDLQADLGPFDPDDADALARVNERVRGRVQQMLDRGRAETRARTDGPELEEPRWVDDLGK